MHQRRLCISVIAALCLVQVAASEAETAPIRCGTRWLMEKRAAGRMLLPTSPPTSSAAKVAQETTAILVGTELSFPVAGSNILVAATCQRVGEHAYIFVENRFWDTNGGRIYQDDVDALGELFDSASPADPARGVYELVTETFGEPADVDGDERIFLLVHDIKNSPNIVGLFDRSVADHPVPEYRRDVLFIDETHLSKSSTRNLVFGTLAHEFQHLIHWRWDDDEDSWVDEGLAGYAEELVGFPEADPNAVPEFLKAPHTSLTDWNFTSSARSYGVTYLFMSFLAERYGHELIREFVAQPRNGTDGLDAAMAARQETDRFVDAWQMWTVGNYAFEDDRYAYRGLGTRRVTTFDVESDMLPLQSEGYSGRWGTANILFRTPGDLLIDFDGDDVGLYSVWTYAMRPTGGTLRPFTLDAAKRGVVQLTGIDSVVLIVGRRSEQGQNFHLSARALTLTAATEEEGAVPEAVAMGSAYPNPFNSSVRIPYTIASHGDVELIVFDMVGQQVRRLAGSRHTPGRYEAMWDGLDGEGRATASGTYLARLQTDGNAYVTTLSLIR